MNQPVPLVIIGGTNPIAAFLMPRLQAAGLTAAVIARRAVAVPEGFTVVRMDLTNARNWIAPAGAVVVSLLPLWVLAQFLPRFIGIRALIAVGSTSRFSKQGSADAVERATAERLAQAESALTRWAERGNVSWTLLRPTLVYDGRRDKNIARMARFVRRWQLLPVAAPAKGLRQPIHADDVAKAIMGAIDNPAAQDKAFNIAGGEVLTYRQMAERVFAACGLKPRFLWLPTGVLLKVFRGLSRIGLLNETSFGASMFQRMNEDLIFDVDAGLAVLRYEPRGFEIEC